MSNESAPFAKLGQWIAERRQQVGLSSQSDFALLVKSSQQTVSRWEAGTSRPRDKQIPLIAAVLLTDVDELLALAGFSRKPVVASFDQPFPVDALTPESFERFCQYFLQATYPEAQVYRAGGQGHTQDGLDVSADFPDGIKFSFQCKRTEEFGPQKVHAAVAKHTIAADKKVLLLTKVASPQARAAVQLHSGWEIWDKEDISQKIRQLSIDDQVRLVDIFFRGQRFALLGVNEAGPWETGGEFFAAFTNADGIFNHVWQLVGRADDLEGIARALNADTISAVLLIGTGGSGKSRILKQAIERYELDHKGVVVRYLSRNAEITKRSLEDLGSRSKLLVVDDAHDQSDLQMLFQYAADPSNKARLVLAFRPYGLNHLKSQASIFSLVGPALQEVVLKPLTLEEAEELATQVLAKHFGPLSAAKDIARLTRDCPLATVVGAQVVAKERLHFDLAQHEDTFRNLLFSRFQDIIAGEIGNKTEAGATKKVLKLLALLQPIHPEDQALLGIVENVEGILPHDTSRILRLLTEAGVLFKRGARFRLSPDVLADYIIEASCVGVEGGSSGYAEIIFDLTNEKQVENLLINLSRLDWRRSNGDPSNSKLIDGVWRKLKPKNEYADPHIRAVKAVAYYQPLKAIEFVERFIREGKFLSQLPEILKFAAYNFEHLTRACEGLWELGKRDARPLNQHPEHPVRILAELCEVQPNQPFEYNERVVDFGLSLVSRPEDWKLAYSPLDILKPIFKTEGHTTKSQNFSLSFEPYFVNADFVLPLRKRVLDAVIDLLSGADIRMAVLAAGSLADAFRYPMGMFNASVSTKTRDEWTEVFVEGLEAVELAIKTKAIDPLVLLAIWRSLSWHANYSKGKTASVARRIKALQPTSLEFRTLTLLVDGYGVELRRIDSANHEKKWAAIVDKLAQDLLAAYPSAEELRSFIAERLAHLRKYYRAESSTPFVLYESLVRASVDYARATLEDAIVDEASETSRFVVGALGTLWSHDRDEARAMANRLIETGREQLIAAVGQAYFSFLNFGGYTESDLVVLRSLMADERVWIARSAINSLRLLSEKDPTLTLSLARAANVGASSDLADDLMVLFTFGKSAIFDQLVSEDVEVLLEKLMPVPQLVGHWIEVFLAEASKKFPDQAAAFFVRRVEHAVKTGDWKYRPANHGPYGHVALKFRESGKYPELLRSFAEWMKSSSGKDFLFSHRARELFETMFGPFDSEVVKFLDEWIATSDAGDMRLIEQILSEADPEFVFKYQPFVERLLEKAKQIDPETLKSVLGSLISSAVSGIRQGVAGEPMPRDIKMKESSDAILQTLPRFSPAFELYEEIKTHAERNIERSKREREAYEDE